MTLVESIPPGSTPRQYARSRASLTTALRLVKCVPFHHSPGSAGSSKRELPAHIGFRSVAAVPSGLSNLYSDIRCPADWSADLNQGVRTCLQAVGIVSRALHGQVARAEYGSAPLRQRQERFVPELRLGGHSGAIPRQNALDDRDRPVSGFSAYIVDGRLENSSSVFDRERAFARATRHRDGHDEDRTHPRAKSRARWARCFTSSENSGPYTL